MGQTEVLGAQRRDALSSSRTSEALEEAQPEAAEALG